MGQKKYRKPQGYEPPTGAQELLERYERGERYFERAQLREANLERCELKHVDLRCGDLSGANLRRAVLVGVDLAEADCRGMLLDHAQLFRCSLAKADARDVWWYMTQVTFVSFFATNLDGAHFLQTLVARGDDQSRVVSSRSQYDSCFVSYSSRDRFALHLEQELQKAEVPNWFMPRSSWFDTSIAENLVRAIELCDVFLLVLSANALSSQWVQHETTSALSLRTKTGAPRMITAQIDQTPLPTGRLSFLAREDVIDCTDWTQGVETLIGRLTGRPGPRRASDTR